MTKQDTAGQLIEHFSTDETGYEPASPDSNLGIINQHESNRVLIRNAKFPGTLEVDFKGAQNCTLYLGANLHGHVTVEILGNDSIVYIGNNCILNGLELRSRQRQDFIAIGNNVSTTSNNIWTSGYRAGNAKPVLIIGDDCMFASDITVRNTDEHPIFSLSDNRQINSPKGDIIIEPHVWICDRASILKSVTIGACSVVALGSVVNRDIPRFSNAKGVPAVSTPQGDTFWSRGYTEHARKKALHFVRKYSTVKS